MRINLIESFYDEKGCRKVETVADLEMDLKYHPRVGEILIHSSIEYTVTRVIHNLDTEYTEVTAKC